jgi:hypothetical protein
MSEISDALKSILSGEENYRHSVSVPQGTPILTINGKEFPVVEVMRGEDGYMSYRVSGETAKEIGEWVESGHQIITVGTYLDCPRCGASGEEGWEFCPYDGTKLDPPGEPIRYEVDEFGQRVA